MNRLHNRVDKLEKRLNRNEEEMIINISFVGSPNSDTGVRKEYPPYEDQVAAGRAEGKKVIFVYTYDKLDAHL